ncbi:hypothetical protein C809_02647 [Lachnospiraceae bacterium MD335]|nr:hypothetical protein C809_02647 [Lachnospiraceae bacterium MD335]
MNVGLIDVDGHSNFPNLPLMKLSAWHKKRGDTVRWYNPICDSFPRPPFDRVYMSKVFTFTPDFPYYINAKEVIKGGTGYSYPDGGKPLDPEIEHIYPDYSLYGITDTAYGFLTRGCPRNCDFCIVGKKEGLKSRKVADLSEFWNGQKNIMLCDPNLIACPDWKDLIQQLIKSKAKVNINQGIDIRIMTEEKAKMIKRLRVDSVHFAWDRYEDKEIIIPKFKQFKEITEWGARKTSVYVLTNFNTTIEQDLERIYTLRDLDYDPYVMIYEKEKTRNDDPVRYLQRWVNNRKIFKTIRRFEDYDPKMG